MHAQRKTAVVIGGSSGIGVGVANAVLAVGWSGLGNARVQPRLDAVAAYLKAGERFL